MNFSGFNDHVSVDMIRLFEQLNNTIAISAFEYKNGDTFCIYHTVFPKRKHRIYLLLLTEGDDAHWVYVKKPGSLFSDNAHLFDLCPYCVMRRKTGTTKHLNLCLEGNEQRQVFPEHTEYSFSKLKSYLPPMFKIFSI